MTQLIFYGLVVAAFNTPLQKAIMAHFIDTKRLTSRFKFVEFVFVF